MARETFENWIPDELGSKPVVAFQQTSVVDRLATHEPMNSDVKRIPRSGGFTVGTVAKGAAYSESTSTNDYVELIARKIGGVERVAEEDLTDPTVDVLAVKRTEAATAMARFFDQATLGTTAAANGTTVPFTSLFYALTQAETYGGYTGNDNVITTAGALTYADLTSTVGDVEGSDYAGDGLVWIAHPAFKGHLRGLLDGDDRPLWQPSGQAGIAGGNVDSLLGYPIYWTRGARKHATATATPTGDPLMFFGDPSFLRVGDAKLPGLPGGVMGTQLQRAATGVGYLTDEALMKAAMRKAFITGVVNTWAVIAYTAS